MATMKLRATDVAHALRGIKFPATKADLITHVHKERDRAQAVLEILHQLPERQYNSMADVERAVGEVI